MLARKSSTLSSLRVLVVTFLKTSPAFFPGATVTWLCADGIQNESDLQADIRQIAIRGINRHAIRLKLLHERFEVLHFKTDVIDRAALRRSGRHAGRQKVHFVPIEHGGGKIAPRTDIRP